VITATSVAKSPPVRSRARGRHGVWRAHRPEASTHASSLGGPASSDRSQRPVALAVHLIHRAHGDAVVVPRAWLASMVVVVSSGPSPLRHRAWLRSISTSTVNVLNTTSPQSPVPATALTASRRRHPNVLARSGQRQTARMHRGVGVTRRPGLVWPCHRGSQPSVRCPSGWPRMRRVSAQRATRGSIGVRPHRSAGKVRP
jgi:hypothetical protein